MVRKELKMLRIQHDLTQEQLSEKIGISKGAYSLIEQGKRVGSDKTWLKIQEIFNLTGEQVWALKSQKISNKE